MPNKRIESILILIKTVFHVLTKPGYFILSFCFALLFLLIVILTSNLSLIYGVVSGTALTIGQKMVYVASLLTTFKTHYSTSWQILIIVTALLFGINLSLLIYFLKQRSKIYKSAGLSLFGMMSALVGTGCAACGSVILTSVIGFSATLAFFAVLPLKGLEFGLISLILIILSIGLIVKNINRSGICKV